MVRHYLDLNRRPVISRNRVAQNSNREEPLFGDHAFSIRQLEFKIPLRHHRSNRIPPNAGLFEQLAKCRFRKALAFLQAATGRRPIILSSEGAALMHESE